MNSLKSKIADIKNVEVEQPADLQYMHDSMVKLKEELEEAVKAKERAEEDLTSFLSTPNPAHDKLKEVREQIRKLAEEVDSIGMSIQDLTSKISKHERNISSFEGKLEKINSKLEEFVATKQAAEEEINAYIESAKQICPEELSPSRPVDAITNEIKRLETKIRREQTSSRSFADVSNQYAAAKAKFKRAKKTIQKLSQLVEHLETSLQKREKFWVDLRARLGKRASVLFNAFMSHKGNSGSLMFDHNNEEMRIQVQLENKGQRKVSNMSTISGGERSFTTTCLLMALWEVMDCPFRALDEFDVFMDNVTRKKSIDVLLQFTGALACRKKQFIFITPHDCSSIQNTPGIDVKVSKMPVVVR